MIEFIIAALSGAFVFYIGYRTGHNNPKKYDDLDLETMRSRGYIEGFEAGSREMDGKRGE